MVSFLEVNMTATKEGVRMLFGVCIDPNQELWDS